MRPALCVLLGVLLVPTVGLVGDIVTDGKFKSTRLTGAPMQVASDDMVANLNADMVDGVEGTDLYTRAEVDALVAVAAAADSRRWFYVTMTEHNGANADTSCDTGFHMASMWEILDVSNIRYDTARGFTLADSGKGPPQMVRGWVRTGDYEYVDPHIGVANCSAWSSSSVSHHGTLVELPDPVGADWRWNDLANRISPWWGHTTNCSNSNRVWCIEN